MNKKLKIIKFGDHLLREPAKPVTVFHRKLHSLIDSISFTLDNQDDGAALAANQVGFLKRITVINYEGEYVEMINPEIIEMDGAQTDNEGCLSFPGYVGLVTRYNRIKVKYQDRNSVEFILERTGNMARCIQHEIDHLNGILFIDRMNERYLTHSETKEKIKLEDALKIAGEKEM